MKHSIRTIAVLAAAVSLSGSAFAWNEAGGEKDEACAAAGIKAVQERLDFAE